MRIAGSDRQLHRRCTRPWQASVDPISSAPGRKRSTPFVADPTKRCSLARASDAFSRRIAARAGPRSQPSDRRDHHGQVPHLDASRQVGPGVWIALSAMKRGDRLTRHDVVRAAPQLRRIDEATADILISQRERRIRRQIRRKPKRGSVGFGSAAILRAGRRPSVLPASFLFDPPVAGKEGLPLEVSFRNVSVCSICCSLSQSCWR